MITGIFGKPRSGKTTYSAMIVQKNHRSKLFKLRHKWAFWLHPYDVIYCTDPSIQNTITIDYSDLGKWRPTPNSLFILEEAGVGLNNRNFKSLTSDAANFFATHGHNHCDILWSSQTVDVDKKLKDRTHFIYLARKVGGFTVLSPITFSVDVDNETHSLDDFYFKARGIEKIINLLFRRTIIFRRKPWYKYFDSFIDTWKYSDIAPDQKPCNFIIEAKQHFSSASINGTLYYTSLP